MKIRFSNRLKVPWLNTTSKKKANIASKEGNASNNFDQKGNNSTDKKDGFTNLNQLPQPQWTRFEGSNPWKPEEHTVLYCMNNQDNVPARMKLENGFVYYISQSRSPGHKDQGQDCMATSKQGDWEVNLLCDGHDKLGHMVALGICQELPKIVLRLINERNTKNPEKTNDEVSDELLVEAFEECSRIVCWTSEGITVGIWVKVFEGQWAGKPGYIKESSSAGKVRVAIIDENGYHLPPIERKHLRRPRYTGGCTCVCLVKNNATRECKVAVSGDSRLMVMPAVPGFSDTVLTKQAGVVSGRANTPEGLVTPAHNVFNLEERDRLQRDYPGQYEFDGNFLVNPITKFAIQPTRGFGDFDMFGTGYTHVPQVSKTFKLQPNSLIFTASDGVFDNHVWQDEEIVSCLQKHLDDGATAAQIVEDMYRETLQRSLEGGYVDDISIYCFREPGKRNVVEVTHQSPDVEEKLDEELIIPTQSDIPKKKDTKEKRRTIGRNGNAYSDLSAQALELRKRKLGIKTPSEKADSVGEEDEPSRDEKLNELIEGDDSAKKLVEGMGQVMKNIATSKGVQELQAATPEELIVKGESFSHDKVDEEPF